ncbi:GNAT family N-acetyltransferase [uncultured Clostridium sp.]|uniref:GNAT family N-acetyltransferase n=1 Tax=uncultured Clostridium sp. TaxID=59620 RepID=UPI00261BDE49|nr:GNAT family protein [uncultured Clostridium sp.]
MNIILEGSYKDIVTNRLILRVMDFDDALEISRLLNNYNIYKVTRILPFPYTEDDALAWIAGHKFGIKSDRVYNLAIVDKNTKELYGTVALSNNKEDNNGELGYWIGEEFWGKGYCTEAINAILDFAFYEKGYNKVFARHFESNIASGKVMQKVFMKKEGFFRNHILKDGEFKNIVYYSILKEEFVKKENM